MLILSPCLYEIVQAIFIFLSLFFSFFVKFFALARDSSYALLKMLLFSFLNFSNFWLFSCGKQMFFFFASLNFLYYFSLFISVIFIRYFGMEVFFLSLQSVTLITICISNISAVLIYKYHSQRFVNDIYDALQWKLF